jgi:hypothetical protein
LHAHDKWMARDYLPAPDRSWLGGRIQQIDDEILALNISKFSQALVECGVDWRRPSLDRRDTDTRHCWLLSTRNERPSCGCAAQKRDELAPSHCIPSAHDKAIVLG